MIRCLAIGHDQLLESVSVVWLRGSAYSMKAFCISIGNSYGYTTFHLERLSVAHTKQPKFRFALSYLEEIRFSSLRAFRALERTTEWIFFLSCALAAVCVGVGH